MAGNEDWAPKTRDEWRDLFADGITTAITREREADAKAKQQEKEQAEKEGKDGEGDPPKTFRERLLGG